MNKGYKKLKIYQLAHKLAFKVHQMTLNKLPKFEMYEEGSQIRKSSKSVSNQIVEGYSLRKYKKQYLHYLWRAYGSCQETIEHLEYLYETNSLQEKQLYQELMDGYLEETRMLFSFIKSVEKHHDPNLFFLKDEEVDYIEDCGLEIEDVECC